MKRKLLAMLLLTCMLFSYVSCSNAGTPTATTAQETDNIATQAPTEDPSQESPSQEEPTQEEPTTAPEEPDPIPTLLDKSKHYNILFIGNSYTSYNDMPEEIFAKIIKDAGYDATVTRLTKGSQYLYNSAKATDTLGKKVDSALKSNKYDFVVLQEQSTCPLQVPETFYTGMREICKKIEANGATPILYETWGRKTGSETLIQNAWTNETMTWGIAASYQAIAKELGISVAYAGLAFYDINTNQPGISIYDSDKSHPNPTGSYLAALTIFAQITGVDPTTVSYNTGLSQSIDAALKEAARKAVFETPKIPDEYKTSSEGIALDLEYTVDSSKVKVLTAFPSSNLISILTGGTYPNGRSFSGILGTKNAVASKQYALNGLTDEQKADIADIGYGISVIGIETMMITTSGYMTAIENMINGHWDETTLGSFAFDNKTYNINGQEDPNSLYTGLITLNFGSKHRFDAIGLITSKLTMVPAAAEVFVSDDGVNWTRVPTACWDQFNGTALTSCGKSPADYWKGNVSPTTCLFGMDGVTGQYIRIGVILGRNDKAEKLNDFSSREIIVLGEKLS